MPPSPASPSSASSSPASPRPISPSPKSPHHMSSNPARGQPQQGPEKAPAPRRPLDGKRTLILAAGLLAACVLTLLLQPSPNSLSRLVTSLGFAAAETKESKAKHEAERQLAQAMAQMSVHEAQDAQAAAREPAIEGAAPANPVKPDALAAVTLLPAIADANKATELPKESPPPEVPAAPHVVTPAPAPPPAPVTLTLPAQPELAPLEDAEVRRLISKAQQSMRDGDIFGARLIYERVIADGNKSALFALAETYDPNVLARMNAKAIKANTVQARSLYEEALRAGNTDAKARIQALNTHE